MKPFSLSVLATCALLSSAALAAAAEPAATGCTSFLWPLETELAWMKAPDAEQADSGATIATLPAGKAIALALKPDSDVAFPVAPTRTPKTEDAAAAFGGVLTIGTVPEGHYQVTISTHAWIDVIQNGKALEATSHTGGQGCDAIRKSVRFELASGPVTFEISGAPKEAIRIAVRPAAD